LIKERYILAGASDLISEIKHIHFKEVIRPLRTIFSTSLGKKDMMKSVIVKVVLKDGSHGLGECPTSFALKQETIPAIRGILNEVSPGLIDTPIDKYENKIERLRRKYAHYPMTTSGLEVALFRACLSNKKVSEHNYWGGCAKRLETDITIPFIPDAELLSRWMKYVLSKRFRIYKLKVSGNVEQDKKLISIVYRMLKGNLKTFTLRLDGNQGYTEKTFSQIINYIEKEGYRIQLFEQPLPKNDYKGLREIKKYSPIPIILDETVLTVKDLQRAIEDNLCDGVNIKIAKSGISESLKILEYAKKYKLTLMIGSMIETMVGLSAGIYCASGTGIFDYIDLDSIHFLHHKNQYGNINIKGSRFIIANGS
jgi:L-alanine-DL-glutamate epimerase-like enolase superfamily enzyme